MIATELDETIEMMNSKDYKERFKAEYFQTKIRYEKLHKMTIKYEAGTLDFEPTCSLSIQHPEESYGRIFTCIRDKSSVRRN